VALTLALLVVVRAHARALQAWLSALAYWCTPSMHATSVELALRVLLTAARAQARALALALAAVVLVVLVVLAMLLVSSTMTTASLPPTPTAARPRSVLMA
jgi:hypothetical protein